MQVGSIYSLVRGHFQVINQLNEDILVYWINFSGEPQLYFSVRPGDSRSQESYVDNTWVAAFANSMLVPLNGECKFTAFYNDGGVQVIAEF